MAKETKHAVDDYNARQRILSAGVDLFAEKGYGSTAVREIVARAGVTKPVLYYYFGSKEGLFRSILEYARSLTKDVADRAWETAGTALERYTILFDSVFEVAAAHRSMVRLMYSLAFGRNQDFPETDLASFDHPFFQIVREIYIEGRDRGELADRDPEVVAFSLYALLDFCVCATLTDTQNSRPELPRQILKQAFDGLGK